MRTSIFSCISLADALRRGVPTARTPFTSLVTGTAAVDGVHMVGELDGDNLGQTYPVLLRAQYYVWRNAAAQADVVGFEAFQRPLFIDPQTAGRARTDYPAVCRLREHVAQDWQSAVLSVSAADLAEYAKARADMGEGDRARLTAWIASTDIVITPALNTLGQPVRRLGIKDRLEAIRTHAQQLGVFQNGQSPIASWPSSLSCIMRADLFRQFAKGLFAVLTMLESAEPQFVHDHATPIGEYLLGMFLADLRYRDPMIRIKQVPLLEEARALALTELPSGFDDASYLRLNPDVAAAGQIGSEHYKRHGYHEGRAWSAPCD